MKQEFIKLFCKEDWKFYNKYPRLFATYLSNKEFTFDDLDRWYDKFICNIDIFQNIVKTLYVINHNEENIESDYRYLEKYNFKYLMDNIDEIVRYEIFPKRIEWQLMNYLKSCQMTSKDVGNAIKKIIEKII